MRKATLQVDLVQDDHPVGIAAFLFIVYFRLSSGGLIPSNDGSTSGIEAYVLICFWEDSGRKFYPRIWKYEIFRHTLVHAGSKT